MSGARSQRRRSERQPSDRRAAQQRQYLFESIRRSTVNYTYAPLRRTPRPLPAFADIDNPLMTRALQMGILLAMTATLIVFHVPLVAAMRAALPLGGVNV